MAKTISDQSIFSEYKKPEDKVTAALLQVLHYGGHKIVETLFDDIDLPSNDINVTPQVTEEKSRPDGFVSCDCKYKIYIESKIVQNAINNEHGLKQREANKKLSSPNDAQWMVYITPDDQIPAELDNVNEIIWINWQTIVERLKGYETNDRLVVFLIEQFCLYVDHIVFKKNGSGSSTGVSLSADLDTGKDQRVIIVGGAWGEGVALDYNFYACQAERYFLPAKYLAFYHKNRIQYLFEITADPIESTSLTTQLGANNPYFINKETNYDGSNRKFFRLKLDKTFDPVIVNDTKDKNGKPCAFTYNQRYTTYDLITKAKKTSDL